MKPTILLLLLAVSIKSFSQRDSTTVKDTTVVNIDNETVAKTAQVPEGYKIFYGQRLINTKTVEVLRKGIMAFTVVHNFGDVASKNGGFGNFFGLDDINDAQIGFQLGLTDHLNIVLNHTAGFSGVRKFYEVGLKYQLIKQQPNSTPLSLTIYGNVVSSADKTPKDGLGQLIPGRENSFETGSDRLSEFAQLMIARRFGNISLQISPAFLHTNFVVQGDQNNLFAIGAGIRVPITKTFVLIADYFHSFRNDSSIATWRSRGVDPHDVFGVGVEILTWGHVFHLNFTNARNILENRFLARTGESWGKGEFRWGFTLARNFTVFNKNRSK